MSSERQYNHHHVEGLTQRVSELNLREEDHSSSRRGADGGGGGVGRPFDASSSSGAYSGEAGNGGGGGGSGGGGVPRGKYVPPHVRTRIAEPVAAEQRGRGSYGYPAQSVNSLARGESAPNARGDDGRADRNGWNGGGGEQQRGWSLGQGQGQGARSRSVLIPNTRPATIPILSVL